jgi:pimeloyl-ACP methyl ester carboxylesterase
MPADFPEPTFITTNGIRMAVYEAGPKDGPPVVLAHGWPELAYAWRHQLKALGEAGYHVMAPDQRGYGLTEKPCVVRQYDIHHLTADMAGLLDAFGHDRAVFAGHDWGGIMVWQMALLHPDRVAGVIGAGAPFFPRSRRDPEVVMREAWGPDWYICDFQDSRRADEAMLTNVEAIFTNQFRKLTRTYAEYQALPKEDRNRTIQKRIDPRPGRVYLSDAERQVYIDTYRKTGFTSTIDWYRNWSWNWESTADVKQEIHVPCLYIQAADDPAVPPGFGDDMAEYIDDVERYKVEDCGHCIQQEHPEEVTRVMLEWLGRKYPARR